MGGGPKLAPLLFEIPDKSEENPATCYRTHVAAPLMGCLYTFYMDMSRDQHPPPEEPVGTPLVNGELLCYEVKNV